MSMKCVDSADSTTCFSLFFFWFFKGGDGEFRASWDPQNYPSEVLLTPGSIPNNRAMTMILGMKSENSWKS